MIVTRRKLVASATLSSGLLLSGCDRLAQNKSFSHTLDSAEGLTFRVQRSLSDRAALAPEYSSAQMSPIFRTNGNTQPASEDYAKHSAEGFKNWKLVIDGLVNAPLTLGLSELMNMPKRTQITQHNCVEGWTAIGKWTGTPLGMLLKQAQLKPQARYVVFHCADTLAAHPIISRST